MGTIPVKKSEMFSTAVDNQTNVEIHILQGERELVAGNKSLGNFRLDGIPSGEKETGAEQSITIQGASNLNESEVEEMLFEAEKYASIDKKKRENIDLKNQAETLCFEAEKEISMFKDNLTEKKREDIRNLIEII